MTANALPRDALMPRVPGGTRRGIGLSVLVHVGLIVAIAFGVNWRSHTPEALQAELWAAVPQAAAPRAVEPEPVAVEVKPVPPPVATPSPAPKVIETPPTVPVPVPDAQIAIEKARLEKLRKAQEATERELEAQRKKLAADKVAADKLRQQQLAEKLKEKEAEAQKLAQDKKQQQAAEDRLAQQREADRKKNIERMLGQAGASGDATARGSALQSAGPSAGYAGRIKARIRPNIVFADEVAGNPTAEVEVRAAADGTILGRKLVKSSGVTAYDNAVLRAIDKTEILPRDEDGRVPASLLLVFRVRE